MSALNPVRYDEILPIADFQAARTRLQARLTEIKGARRLQLGDAFWFTFENRDTVRWQVQEMCRVEGITQEAGVLHELATYNALLPGPDTLSATLLIGYADPAVRDVELRRLVGLPQHLTLQIDGLPPLPVQFDGDQYNEERLSSVQFLRIPLGGAAGAFRDFSRAVRLVSTHPAHPGEALIGPGLRGALIGDMAEQGG